MTRRRVRRAVLCLVLGGVMTVAVAWASVLLGGSLPGVSKITSHFASDNVELGFLERFRFSGASMPFAHFPVSSSSGYFWRATGASGKVIFESRIVPRELRRDYTYGFPFRAMTVVSGNGSSGLPWDFPDLNKAYVAADGGLEVSAWLPVRFQDRRLPLRLVWPGFLYSTLAYGGILWLALWLPGVLRRRHRCQHGLCLHCKYPVADFTVCPECGNPTGREA